MGTETEPGDVWGTVEVFSHRGMAEVAGSALRSAGVPHRLISDDMRPPTYRPLETTFRGVELQVLADQVDDARALLEAGVKVRPETYGQTSVRPRRSGVDGPLPSWIHGVAWAILILFVLALLYQSAVGG